MEAVYSQVQQATAPVPWRGQQAAAVLFDQGGGGGDGGSGAGGCEDADAPLLPTVTAWRRARLAAQRGKSTQQPSSAEKGTSEVNFEERWVEGSAGWMHWQANPAERSPCDGRRDNDLTRTGQDRCRTSDYVMGPRLWAVSGVKRRA